MTDAVTSESLFDLDSRGAMDVGAAGVLRLIAMLGAQKDGDVTSRRRVLGDHAQRVKRLLPPFVHHFGPLSEVSWVRQMIPEFSWIGLVQDRHGHREGVELITALARAARESHPEEFRSTVFATASSYSRLSTEQSEALRAALVDRGCLFPIQRALEPLVVLYPDCPLKVLFSSGAGGQSDQHERVVRQVVQSLYARAEYGPMMVQATAIWLAFDAGILHVNPDVALAQFPEIEAYPDTEISRRVGASIRASLNLFFGSEQMTSGEWPRYFWNRGLEISRCEFSDER